MPKGLQALESAFFLASAFSRSRPPHKGRTSPFLFDGSPRACDKMDSQEPPTDQVFSEHLAKVVEPALFPSAAGSDYLQWYLVVLQRLVISIDLQARMRTSRVSLNPNSMCRPNLTRSGRRSEQERTPR